MIDRLSSVFDCPAHMFSSMDSISTRMREYTNQNTVEFDMNDILSVVHIDANQPEHVMVHVLETADLFGWDFHIPLDMSSRMTKAGRDMDLELPIHLSSNERIDFLRLQSLEFFISIPVFEQTNCVQLYV